MDIYTACEQAYKNGYLAGIKHVEDNYQECAGTNCFECLNEKNNISSKSTDESTNEKSNIDIIKEKYNEGFLAGVKKALKEKGGISDE